MALIACPECGQNISNDAPACPHCGLVIDPRRTMVDYVTGEVIGIQRRPGARSSRPPQRYPSPTGMFMMVLGAVLVAVGSVMPWVRLGAVSISGLESNGRITVVVGLLMLILALSSRTAPSRFPRILVIFGAFLVIAIAAVDNARLREGLPGELIGAGIGTIIAGGVLALIGGFLRER